MFRPDLWWIQQWKPTSNKGELGHVRAISGGTGGMVGDVSLCDTSRKSSICCKCLFMIFVRHCVRWKKIAKTSLSPRSYKRSFAILMMTERPTTLGWPHLLTPPNDFGLSQSHRRQASLVYRQVRRDHSSSPAVIALASNHPVSEDYILQYD